MGSSETEEGILDCGAGCIVWVRRRNGSWWPGKILGPDELSTSHVMTPRSGTAVKLLGRDDASVDWYNLEKSKRVKAFRCGEFDDCIERAEASLGMPPKKREKYARREDAIIHALELERQLAGGKNGKTSYSCNDKINKSPDDNVRRDVVTSPECFEYQNQEQLSLKSHKASESSGLQLKDENGVSTLCGDVGPKGNQLSGDNYSILPPRKRGLHDFGLSTAPSEHKPPVDSSGTNKPFTESTALPDESPNKVGLINANKESLLDEKALSKKRDRHHLVQVSNSTEKLPVSYPQPDRSNVLTSVSGEEQFGVVCHAKKGRYTYGADDSRDGFNGKINLPTETDISTSKLEGSDYPHPDESCEEKTSESTECTETDSCRSDSQESDSDDDIATLAEGATCIELRPKYLGRSEAHADHGSTSSEDSDDLSGADSHPYLNNTVSASVGVSKWLLKGKRNNRGVVKRSLDTYEENHLKRPSYMTNPVEKRSYGGTEANSLMKSRAKMAGYGSRVAGTWNAVNLGDLSWNDQHTKGDWANSGEYLDPLCNYHHLGGPRMLIDVDLKVQAGYKRQPVPLISLTSKKYGQAIVGHPVKVEVLENGAFESLYGAVDDICPETLDDASHQPMWRTARRTAGARVPRPHLSSIERDRNVSKASSTGFGQKASPVRKSASQPPLEKALSKRPHRNGTMSSNQKIRTLSSIASQQKQSSDMKRSFNSFQVNGLLKQESMPTVACIPVKLVFSRLNEELVGRHP
nr:uncharacterized protein At1g51745-like [Ipomoea trifida]